MLAGRIRPVERTFTLAPVKTAEMAARQRHPEHAVGIDVAAARPEAGSRHLIELGERGMGRIVARCDARRAAGIAQHAPPNCAVGGADRHAVVVHRDALVLGRVERLIGLDPFVPPAVAIGVEDEWRPALRPHLIACLLVHFSIEPPEHAGAGDAGAGPQCIVGVRGEVEMVGRKTRMNQREPAGCRIVKREVAAAAVDRECLR